MGELPNARNLLLYFVPFVFFVDELRFLSLIGIREILKETLNKSHMAAHSVLRGGVQGARGSEW